jgi:hypothetical protein
MKFEWEFNHRIWTELRRELINRMICKNETQLKEDLYRHISHQFTILEPFYIDRENAIRQHVDSHIKL